MDPNAPPQYSPPQVNPQYVVTQPNPQYVTSPNPQYMDSSHQPQPQPQIVYQQVTYTDTTAPLLGRPCWGEIPQRHHCQFCQKDIVTEVVYEVGTLTWLIAGGVLLVGGVLGCCLIPFCVDGCKDPVHLCPHCHNMVGRKNRI